MNFIAKQTLRDKVYLVVFFNEYDKWWLAANYLHLAYAKLTRLKYHVCNNVNYITFILINPNSTINVMLSDIL